MKAESIDIESSNIPRLVKIIGKRGKYALYLLKTGGRKLGAQLVKLNCNNAHLLEQH